MAPEAALGAMRPEATAEHRCSHRSQGRRGQVPESPEGAAPQTPWISGFWPPDCERTSFRGVQPPVRSHLMGEGNLMRGVTPLPFVCRVHAWIQASSPDPSSEATFTHVTALVCRIDTPHLARLTRAVQRRAPGSVPGSPHPCLAPPQALDTGPAAVGSCEELGVMPDAHLPPDTPRLMPGWTPLAAAF